MVEESFNIGGSHPWAAGGSAGLFVGRQEELSVLAGCRSQAAGGTPCLVIVEGEPGIGKTALVRQGLAGPDNLSSWWAYGDPSEQDLPFAVVDQWLRRLARSGTDLSSRGSLLGPEVLPSTVGARLLDLVGTAQDCGPVTLVLDDAQWADGESLQALGFVLRRLSVDRLLVVLTSRTSGTGSGALAVRSDRLTAGPLATKLIRLSGLGEEEIAQFAEPGHDFPPGLAHRLREYTGGHPLYLRSLLGTATFEELAQTPVLPVPTELASMISRTLAELPGESRALAEAMAVLNVRVPLAWAGLMSGVADTTSALAPLLQSALAEWEPSDPVTPVRITHQLSREAIYQATPPARRRDLHEIAAQLVGADAAWAHRMAACDHPDENLAKELEEEAHHQAETGRRARAAKLLLWASQISESRHLFEHRLLNSVSHTENLFRRDELRAAVDGCAPCAQRTHLLSVYANDNGDFSSAVQLGEKAAAQAEKEAESTLHVHARLRLGISMFHAGERVQAVELVQQLDDAAGGRDSHVRYILGLLQLMVRGAPNTLREPWITALTHDAPISPVNTVGHLIRGNCRLALGELHAARGDLLAGLNPERASGLPWVALVHTRVNLAACQYLMGAWEDGMAQIERSLADVDVSGNRSHELTGHVWAAIITAGQGHWERAYQHLHACRECLILPLYADGPQLAAAAIAQARGDAQAMLQALAAEHSRALAENSTWPNHQFWPMWAEALIDAGRLAEAADALEHLRRQCEQTSGFLRPITAFAAGRLTEAQGEPNKAAIVYHEVLDEPVSPDDPPLHRARLEHAACLLHQRLGHSRLSVTLAESAYDRYRAIGAEPFLARLASELTKAGISTQGSTSSSAAAEELTGREMDVAGLAARGLTNREIGQQLFVSAKTVEYHLGHVYAKLHITSRRQLRTTLTPA
jgi:DNA-binding CsgD family transcriptional regulator/tetratricopeptide (TPR) repeat protein